jgi:hypothetical protein
MGVDGTTGSRPLLYPVAAWNGAPTHRITCVAVGSSTKTGGGGSTSTSRQTSDSADHATKQSPSGSPLHRSVSLDWKSRASASAASAAAAHLSVTCSPGSPSPTFTERSYARYLVTGSTTGELVHWELQEGTDQRPRYRPRALLFHAGAARCTAVARSAIGAAPVFVAASKEGFLSSWNEQGGRCRRSALVLPFAANRLCPLYLYGSRSTGNGGSISAQSSSSRQASSSTSSRASFLSTSLGSTLSQSTKPTQSYLICANVGADEGASSEVYVVKLPKFNVAAIFQHTSKLIAIDIPEQPHGHVSGVSGQGQGHIGSGGPFLTTLAQDGTVSMWKLSEYLGAGKGSTLRKSNGSGSGNIPPQLQQAGFSSLGSSALASAALAASHSPTLSATSSYISVGTTCYTIPDRTFVLPNPTMDNLCIDDPLLSHQTEYALRSPGPVPLPGLEPTAMSTSRNSKWVLITSEKNFMLVNTQHCHLEMKIQSIVLHLDRRESSSSSNQHHHHRDGSDSHPRDLRPWHPNDALVGCGFLDDDSQHQRFVLWSAQGRVLVFQLRVEGEASSVSPPAKVGPITANSVVPSSAPVHVRLFAECHFESALSSSAERRPCTPLLLPNNIELDGDRILCGNDAGEIYQFVIPTAAGSIAQHDGAEEQHPHATPATHMTSASLAEYVFDPVLSLWHIRPSQVVSVASAFAPSGGASSRGSPQPTAAPHVPPTPHYVRRSSSADFSNRSAVLLSNLTESDSETRISSLRGPHSAAHNSATASCMLVDSIRKHVMFAEGYSDGRLRLIHICGPARGFGTVGSFYSPQANIEMQHHTATVTTLLSVEKPLTIGEGSSVILVSGSLDGTVATWEMHSARQLHTFSCGSPVISIFQPLSLPTIAALVSAQKAGLLFPSTSDCVSSAASSSSFGSWVPSAGDQMRPVDYDAIYRLPPPNLLFVATASNDVQALLLQAHDNATIVSHLQANHSATVNHPAELALQTNHFLQVYRGHDAPVAAVFFNAFLADHDLVVTQTDSGKLFLFCFSTGQLEAVISDSSNVQEFLQNFDLVQLNSQLSIMSFQLRQLGAFAPGLFQLANEGDNQPLLGSPSPLAPLSNSRSTSGFNPPTIASPAAVSHARSSSNLRPGTGGSPPPQGHPERSSSPLDFARATFRRVQSNLKRVGSRLTQDDSNALPAPLFGNSNLGSSAGYARGVSEPGFSQGYQNHILSTYILNRFLFHQQNPTYNASILSNVFQGAGQGADGKSGTAAIVYRPSLLKRTGAGQSIRPLELSPAHISLASRLESGTHDGFGSDQHANFGHLQLAVYALDIQQLNVDLLTKYAQLTSSAPAAHPSAAHAAGTHSKPDLRREAQAAWHSVLNMLFDWDDSPGSVSELLKSHLNFTPPAPAAQQAYAIFSDRAQALSVLFPSYSKGHKRWTFDPECSALHLLSLSTVLIALQTAADSQSKSFFQKVLSYYHNSLPLQFHRFVECDLNLLAVYSLSIHENIALAARMLLHGAIERSNAQQRLIWWKEWSTVFTGGVYSASQDAWKRNVFSLALMKKEEHSAAEIASPSSKKRGSIFGFGGAGGSSGSVSGTSSSNLHALAASPSPGGGPERSAPPAAFSPSSPGIGAPIVGGSPAPTAASGGGSSLFAESVSDKEAMAALVLTSIFVLENNEAKWISRERKFAEGAAAAAAAVAAAAQAASGGGEGAGSISNSDIESKLPWMVHTLLRMLAFGSSSPHSPVSNLNELVKITIACDLLNSALPIFARYIPNESLPLLIRRLQFLVVTSSACEKALGSGSSPGALAPAVGPAQLAASPALALHLSLLHSARRLLLEFGRKEPDMFFYIIGKELLLRGIKALPALERASFLSSLNNLVRKYPRAAQPVLIDIAHTFVKLIHPDAPQIRAQMWSTALETFRFLASVYAQCALHEQSSHFAVGTGVITYHHVEKSSSSSASKEKEKDKDKKENTQLDRLPGHTILGPHGQLYGPHRSAYPFSIMIFDLKTSGKWRILEGHKADVTAIAFNPSGTMLASYCAKDIPNATVKVWQLGTSGFVSDLIHSHGKCVKTEQLPSVDLSQTVAREIMMSQRQAFQQQQRKVASQQERVERTIQQFSHATVATTTTATIEESPESPSNAARAETEISAAGSGSTVSSHHVEPTPPLATIGAPPLHPPPSRAPPVLNRPVSTPIPAATPLPPGFAAHRRPSLGHSVMSVTRFGFPVSNLSCISSAQLEEEEETPSEIELAKLLAAKIKWQGDAIVVTREDGATTTIRV